MVNYNRLVQYGIDKHNITISTERVELALLYYGSVLASTSNLRIYNQDQDRLENANFFGMLFMPSGAGKDFAKSVYDNLFSRTTKSIPYAIAKFATDRSPNGDKTSSFPEKYDKKIHKHFSTSISSSDIGLYITALAVMNAKFGSLNIEINEFADHIGKSENIVMLKELYDGKLMAKTIQGNGEDEARVHVTSITTNALIYGSPKSIKENQSKMKVFKDLTSSGMYRRSIIYYEEPMKSELKEPITNDVSDILDALHNAPIKNSIISLVNGDVQKSEDYTVAMFSDESVERLKELMVEMHELKNSNLDDDLLANDTFAHKLIEKIAAIVAYLDLSDTVELSHVEYSIGLFKRTRATISKLFEQIPVFEKIYKTISRSSNPLMQSDIIKRSDINVKEFADNIELVNEIAYINNQQLVSSVGSTVLKKYSLEPLPYNDLKKIIISISTEKKMAERSTKFKPMAIPMFDSEVSLEKLVIKDDIDCFTLAHYEPNMKDKNNTTDGHRGADYFIKGQNTIAFDVDSGMTINEAVEKLKDYVYVLYTTKSHGMEGKGDRFRVIVPTRTTFYVDPEQHKQMYDNVAERIGFQAYDIQTKNVSRLWFTNPEAQVICKKDGDLLDVRCCLPDTNSEKRVRLAEQDIDERYIDARVKGMCLWFVRNTFKGERNANLFRLAKYLIELNIADTESIINRMNQAIDEPLKDSEINTIIRSAKK